MEKQLKQQGSELRKRGEKNGFQMGMKKSEISKETERETSRGSSVPRNSERYLGEDGMRMTTTQGRRKIAQ